MGGGSSIDPDELLSINFGAHHHDKHSPNKKPSRKNSELSMAKPLNFYGDKGGAGSSKASDMDLQSNHMSPLFVGDKDSAQHETVGF